MHNHFGIEIFSPIGVLYNILLLINQYSGSIAKDMIAKTMNKIRISHGYLVISSDLIVIASVLSYCIRSLDISNPHGYADICY